MAAESFVGVRVAGGLLPAELLSRIAAGELAGQTSGDYHLAPGETVREAANRAWAYLTGVWATYRQAAEKLPESDRGTTLTRERWLLILLRELGYGRVPTTPAGGLTAGDKRLPISHVWESVPMHLLGHRVDLDRRTVGVAGAATSSPQSMVQELLNRSDANQWAILSNGLTLRLLRDSTSLVGSAYIEFDLEAIFDGDLFADFLLLFSVCHQSRLEVRDPEKGPASCWLEAWRTESLESGSRALNQLRDGVIQAITTLGTGLLGHPANTQLRDGLADGSLRIEDVNHGLLRVVYRLLFTFVAEDRGLLLAPDADPAIRQRYRDYFSTERLRRTARRRRGTRHTDQWRALNLVWDGLGSVDGRPELGLVGIGGLFEPGALDLFRGCDLSNDALLRAVRYLSLVEEPGSKMKRVVDYRHLGAEELGSIYEALLEFVPSWDAGRREFELLSAAGNDRKSTGSYYTPTSLIDCLLDSALDPVLDRAEREPDPEAALLALTVCDPACGSGHFLVAAARRIAKRIAAIRTGDPEPPPERVREALADVVGRCIYGVDLNPLAAELAKVSLWLETLDPGRPLAFLDAQIKVGNSLIGATPALLADGVPDEAFAVLEGDDKKIVTALKKQNKAERFGQDELFGDDTAPTLDAAVAGELGALIVGGRPASLADIHARQQRLKALEANRALQQQRLVADAWCAAFVWPKQPGGPKPITDRSLHALARGEELPAATLATIHELAAEYRFFHWHLEFPHVFPPISPPSELEWGGGFDAVLGNPPWEQSEIAAPEFLASLIPSISALTDPADRERAISIAKLEDSTIEVRLSVARRQAQALTHFARTSGRYPLTARGRVNLYHLFAELSECILGSGRAGVILPSGVLTDLNASELCAHWIQSGRLGSAFDFVNTKKLFESVKPPVRFSLITFAGTDGQFDHIATFSMAQHPTDLLSRDRLIEFPVEFPRLVNHETGSLPLLRNAVHYAITNQAYSEHVPFGATSVSTRQGFLNMTTDAHQFLRLEDLQEIPGHWDGRTFVANQGGIYLPVIESKLFTAYDIRSRSFLGVPASSRFVRRASPRLVPLAADTDLYSSLPRYWIHLSQVKKEWPSERGWALVGKEVTDGKTSTRASVFTVAPFAGISYTCQVVYSDSSSPIDVLALLAVLNSLAFDFFARQKISGMHLTASILRQLPVPNPAALDAVSPLSPSASWRDWLAQRAYALADTSPELRDLEGAIGVQLEPVRDEIGRRLLVDEIDAAMMLLYGFSGQQAEAIIDSFDLLRKQELSVFRRFQKKESVLRLLGEMERGTFKSRLGTNEPVSTSGRP